MYVWSAATDIPYPDGALPQNVVMYPIAATMVCPVYHLNVFGQNDDSSLSDVSSLRTTGCLSAPY